MRAVGQIDRNTSGGLGARLIPDEPFNLSLPKWYARLIRMADEKMLQEAINAVYKGEKIRARDLLTRLLKTDQANPTYWLWMSTVVDTPKERGYCLQEVLKRDPHNEAARRGLVFLGMLPPTETNLTAEMPHRNWQVNLPESKASKSRLLPGVSGLPRLLMFFGAGVVALTLIIMVGVLGTRRTTARVILTPAGTAKPTATYITTNTPVVRSPTPTFMGPTPLAMLLKSTYTPTPLYVNTPHPRSEAYRSALTNMGRGDYAKMLSFMQQVNGNEPNSPDVLYYLGESYRLTGDDDTALKQYQLAVEANPAFAPAYLGRARANFALDPETDVLPDLQKAIELDPTLKEAYLELANVWLAQGEPQKALDILDEQADQLKDSPLDALYRAQAYLQLKDAPQAVENARRANELDLTLLPAYLTLGQALQANGQMAESLAPLETYARYETGDANVWVWLGTAYDAAGNEDQALEAFNRALGLNNRLFDAYLQRGWINLDRKRYNDALDDFSTAQKLDKKSWEAALGLGETYLMLEYPGDAYMTIDRAQAYAERDDQRAQLYYWRARALDAAGRTDAADTDWKKLLGLPETVVPSEWAQEARTRLSSTATPAAVTANATLTPTPK